jgi:hypothetical protein
MSEINRSLIIVRPKQPFLDWLSSLDPDNANLQPHDLNYDATAFLIPEFETDDAQREIIDWCAEYVFEHELWSWYTDQDLWPVGRNAEMFREWFEVEFHSLVFDLDSNTPLEHIEYDNSVNDESPIDPNSNGH